MGLTDEEKKVMINITNAHNDFVKLDSTHSSESIDWCNAIHKLQSLIALRVLRRDQPEIFEQ